VIPLTAATLALLATLPRFNEGDCLFSINNGVSPVTFRSKAKGMIDDAIPGVTGWCIHDLRRTMRTNISDESLGISFEVAEAMVAHKKKGLNAVYNMYEYRDEKRAGFEAWHAKLDRIVNNEVHRLTA